MIIPALVQGEGLLRLTYFTMRKTVLYTAALFAALAVSASAALSTAQISAIDKSIDKAKTMNVPKVAAKLVEDASSADRQDVVVQVIRSTKAHKAGAMERTVKAISEKCPEMASVAAVTAVGFSKSSAARITKIAVKAAPEYAEDIANEVTKVAPAYAEDVMAVSAGKPVVAEMTVVQPVFGKDAFGNDVQKLIVRVVAVKPGVDPRRPVYVAP